MEIKLLSCPLCLKPHFEGVDSLRTSLIAAATSQISCPVCNELLLGLDKLTIHLFSHITNQLIQDNAKNTQQNETVQLQVSAACDNPREDFQPVQSTSVIELTENNLVVDNGKEVEENSLRCDICNFSFSDENILEMHQKLLHQTQADQETGRCSYHCHLCSKKFKMKGSLMVHLRVAHYGFGHHADANKPATVNEEASPEKLDNKQWACDVCSKLFTTKYFLKKHKRLHTGEMPYFCAQCSKSFTFQQSYHKHMLYHSSEKPHVCNECGRAFKELSTLHNHQRIHSGERPFACETCGKCFRQRVSYLVHRRIHTGVMPYKCTACDKSFRYKVSQKSHKCPMNPPGSVVRAPILVDKLMQKNLTRNDTNSSKVNSIVFDVNGQIVEQNFTFNGENLVREDTNKNFVENLDFFAMVMSPELPDVQTLYLSSPQGVQQIEETPKPNLETINQECFKELLYGPLD